MYRFRKLVREIHRRSVWQVLGIYLGMAWAVLSVVDTLTGFAGLPSWTPTMALVLLMIGLPIVIATAFIQSGVPGLTADPHEEIHPDDVVGKSPEEVHVVPEAHPMHGSGIFTWRNAILGGVAAAVVLVGSVVAYLMMWTMGIGPVGSLVAQGVLLERDPIILAEFENRTDDVSLGAVVTGALAVDLGESQTVTLLNRAAVTNALTMMGRNPNEQITERVAQEVAVRENIKAVVGGEVSRVGSRYLLVARIVIPATGDAIVSFRENASGEDDLLPAIDRLSARLREKMGESLKTIRLGAPLAQVTTSSLDALRKYTSAVEAEAEGDYTTAMRLLDEAVALDGAFAMAYRKIGVLRFNTGAERSITAEASALAYEHRDRLTELERHLAEAQYHNHVTRDADLTIAAYEAALLVDPTDGTALNNLSNLLGYRARYEEAFQLLRRATSLPFPSTVASFNWSRIHLQLGDTDGARQAHDTYVARYPTHIYVPWGRYGLAAWASDLPEIHAAADVLRDEDRTPFLQSEVPRLLLAADAYGGRVAEAMTHFAADAPVVGPKLWLGKQGISVLPLGGPDVDLWILDDSAAVATSVATLLGEAGFSAAPAAERAWLLPILTLAQAGHTEQARGLYDAWEREVAPEDRDAAHRDAASAVILASEGETRQALDLIERAATSLGCARCVEQYTAQIYEDLDRIAEAIEIWEMMRDFPREIEVAPWSRIVAMKRLGPLHEQVGDTAAAITAYEAFAEAWEDADTRLQPQVHRARDRIAALGGN